MLVIACDRCRLPAELFAIDSRPVDGGSVGTNSLRLLRARVTLAVHVCSIQVLVC